ncbi:interferon-induced GTP-binding protein Mx3-like isoform X2 [Scyliorhinus torazame]|uniref:interferon-induced GTP-binding protein Mx3-like isoform X2 n=1 Tax=Scyliorhinus torazame TaxID=75743 RepID=UPI003B5B2F08
MSIFCDKYEEKVRGYINIIDEMRSMGIDKEFALPTIAVIGDQSSGKSSVLEMLSDVALPRGNGVVTRCPLELKLKKVGGDRPWRGQISYRDYAKTLDHVDQVEDEILKAQDLLTDKTAISSELISLQVESINAPDLTLIDLPGIIRVPVGNQPQDVGKMTKQLIEKFIQKKETIILVVIPCTMDIATTEALAMARVVDPEGERTLGVLTKPDLVDKGTEEDIIKILDNKVVPLKKGYMLVKCRGQKGLNANTTMNAALEEEITFLKNNSHFRPLLENGLASFDHLSEKLTSELIHQITKILTYCDEITNLVTGDYRKDYANEKKLCDFSRKVFSEWFNRLELEKVKLNDEALSKVRFHDKYSQGRELPGFTKYRIFESVIREQIHKLLLPSLQVMKEVGDKVQQVFNAMLYEHFNTLPKLLQASKELIAEIRRNQELATEQNLRLHFNMEGMVYAPDAMYSFKLEELQSRSQNNRHTEPSPSSGHSSNIMAVHLQVYYQIAIDRLIQMVPMVTRYHLLQEFASQVKFKMAQTFMNEEDADGLLTENFEIAKKRKSFTDSLNQLNKARAILMSNEISKVQ